MTPPATSLTWIKTAKSSPSRTAVERLEQAALDLLNEGVFEHASAPDIARRAGVQPSTFYSRYPDKEALLHAVHESFLADAAATSEAILALERWEGRSIPEIIRETVTFVVRTYREREGLIRAFLVRAGLDEEVRERSLAFAQLLGEQLRKLILARRKELLHPAPAIAAEFSIRVIHGVLQARALTGDHGESGQIKLTDEQIITELIHAVLAYLGVFSADTWDS